MNPLRHGLLLATLLLAPLVLAEDHTALLDQVVGERSAQERARDPYRHPVQTLAFFRVEPGMTVAEGLPGGGWYTRILANYLGADGTLIGVNYPESLWPHFGRPQEWVTQRIASTSQFPQQVDS